MQTHGRIFLWTQATDHLKQWRRPKQAGSADCSTAQNTRRYQSLQKCDRG